MTPKEKKVLTNKFTGICAYGLTLREGKWVKILHGEPTKVHKVSKSPFVVIEFTNGVNPEQDGKTNEIITKVEFRRIMRAPRYLRTPKRLKKCITTQLTKPARN